MAKKQDRAIVIVQSVARMYLVRCRLTNHSLALLTETLNAPDSEAKDCLLAIERFLTTHHLKREKINNFHGVFLVQNHSLFVNNLGKSHRFYENSNVVHGVFGIMFKLTWAVIVVLFNKTQGGNLEYAFLDFGFSNKTGLQWECFVLQRSTSRERPKSVLYLRLKIVKGGTPRAL